MSTLSLLRAFVIATEVALQVGCAAGSARITLKVDSRHAPGFAQVRPGSYTLPVVGATRIEGIYEGISVDFEKPVAEGLQRFRIVLPSTTHAALHALGKPKADFHLKNVPLVISYGGDPMHTVQREAKRATLDFEQSKPGKFKSSTDVDYVSLSHYGLRIDALKIQGDRLSLQGRFSGKTAKVPPHTKVVWGVSGEIRVKDVELGIEMVD